MHVTNAIKIAPKRKKITIYPLLYRRSIYKRVPYPYLLSTLHIQTYESRKRNFWSRQLSPKSRSRKHSFIQLPKIFTLKNKNKLSVKASLPSRTDYIQLQEISIITFLILYSILIRLRSQFSTFCFCNRKVVNNFSFVINDNPPGDSPMPQFSI